MNTQYKKGVLELCVLALLSRRDCYGYDVAEYLSRHMDLSDGAVYPILRKLKEEGQVTTYLSEDSGGPARKYYRLTAAGREEFERAQSEWLQFTEAVDKILKEKGNE